MEVILLEDVKNVGKKGEVVKVNDGYGRNVLIKKKQAIEATGKNLNDLKLKKANDDKIAAENLEAAKELAAKLEESEPLVPYLQRKLQKKPRHSWDLILIKRRYSLRMQLRLWEPMRLRLRYIQRLLQF